MQTETVMDAVESARAEQGRCAARVNELRDKQLALTAKIDELADRAKSGRSAGNVELSSLANEKNETDHQLTGAQRALDLAANRLANADATSRRERLENLFIGARQQRSQFELLFRDCCLALGSFCRSMEKATELSNSLVGVLDFPHDRNRLQELGSDLDPLPRLRGSLEGTLQFGWRLSCGVVPLHKKGE